MHIYFNCGLRAHTIIGFYMCMCVHTPNVHIHTYTQRVRTHLLDSIHQHRIYMCICVHTHPTYIYIHTHNVCVHTRLTAFTNISRRHHQIYMCMCVHTHLTYIYIHTHNLCVHTCFTADTTIGFCVCETWLTACMCVNV